MRPILTSELVNGAVGDVALLIDFKLLRRALFFDLGEADVPSAVPFHFSPRYLDRELEVRAVRDRLHGLHMGPSLSIDTHGRSI